MDKTNSKRWSYFVDGGRRVKRIFFHSKSYSTHSLRRHANRVKIAKNLMGMFPE